MRVIQSLTGVADHGDGLLDLEPLRLAQQVGAGGAIHVLHDDVVPAALRVPAGIEDLDHVGVH